MEYEREWDYLRKRIRQLRTERNLSIQALADYANMERKNLSNIESGIAGGITLHTICKIAEALEVAPGELVRR